jgi:hypothetical protein
LAKGKTVDEPTTRISWRAPPDPPDAAWSLQADKASVLIAMMDSFFIM